MNSKTALTELEILQFKPCLEQQDNVRSYMLQQSSIYKTVVITVKYIEVLASMVSEYNIELIS